MRDPGYTYSPTGSASAVLAEESARVFMQRVYMWMAVGLGITGATSFIVASSQQLTSIIVPMGRPIMLVAFLIAVIFSFVGSKVSGPVAAVLFFTYAFLLGLGFSVLFLIFELGSIASTFAITAGTFAAMSAYGTVTKKNLSGWGSFLLMGLIGIIIAGIVNIFMQSNMLAFVCSCAGVVIFAGLTAYDTQKLREHHANSGYSSAMSLAIFGALVLYLDFVNLFIRLLYILGKRR